MLRMWTGNRRKLIDSPGFTGGIPKRVILQDIDFDEQRETLCGVVKQNMLLDFLRNIWEFADNVDERIDMIWIRVEDVERLSEN